MEPRKKMSYTHTYIYSLYIYMTIKSNEIIQWPKAVKSDSLFQLSLDNTDPKKKRNGRRKKSLKQRIEC